MEIEEECCRLPSTNDVHPQVTLTINADVQQNSERLPNSNRAQVLLRCLAICSTGLFVVFVAILPMTTLVVLWALLNALVFNAAIGNGEITIFEWIEPWFALGAATLAFLGFTGLGFGIWLLRKRAKKLIQTWTDIGRPSQTTQFVPLDTTTLVTLRARANLSLEVICVLACASLIAACFTSFYFIETLFGLESVGTSCLLFVSFVTVNSILVAVIVAWYDKFLRT